MAEPDWYEVAQGPDLLQGDLLLNCPVFTVSGDIPYPLPDDFEPALDVSYYDLIVLTHSCDLQNAKVEEILLAQVIAWPEAVRAGGTQNPALKSREFRRALIAGNVPGLLCCTSATPRPHSPGLSWTSIAFSP